MSNIHFELFKFMNEHGDKTQDVRKSVMTDREKVIKGLEIQLDDLQKYADSDEILTLTQEQAKEIVALLKEQEYKDRMFHALEDDWKAMLKEQDEEHRRLLSWLGKFCRHIDNGDAWLTDEENIAFFKKKMKQQFGWDTD